MASYVIGPTSEPPSQTNPLNSTRNAPNRFGDEDNDDEEEDLDAVPCWDPHFKGETSYGNYVAFTLNFHHFYISYIFNCY